MACIGFTCIGFIMSMLETIPETEGQPCAGPVKFDRREALP
jgi:hypothetical protein